jgi:hypothetical protein
LQSAPPGVAGSSETPRKGNKMHGTVYLSRPAGLRERFFATEN